MHYIMLGVRNIRIQNHQTCTILTNLNLQIGDFGLQECKYSHYLHRVSEAIGTGGGKHGNRLLCLLCLQREDNSVAKLLTEIWWTYFVAISSKFGTSNTKRSVASREAQSRYLGEGRARREVDS